jgi:hypothetical protein
MHTLPDYGMEQAYDTGPDADVSSQVAGDRHPLLSKRIPRPNEKSSGEQNQCWISRRKA